MKKGRQEKIVMKEKKEKNTVPFTLISGLWALKMGKIKERKRQIEREDLVQINTHYNCKKKPFDVTIRAAGNRFQTKIHQKSVQRKQR